MVNTRSLFRTQLNIYDEVFFSKIVNSFQLLTIFLKSSIRDVRLGSKYASEHYNKFFSWRFLFKVNYFLNLFSTIDFCSQCTPEAKVHSEPSRTSEMELFREFIFSKIHKKTPVPESFFK